MDDAGFREWLRKNIDKMGSQKAFSRANGVNQSVVSLVLGGVRDPSDEFLEAVGVEKVVTYRPKALKSKEGEKK